MAAMADPAVRAAGPDERWRFPAAMFGDVIVAGKLEPLREIADAVRARPRSSIRRSILAGRSWPPNAALPIGLLRLPAPARAGCRRGHGRARRAALAARSGWRPIRTRACYRGSYLDPCPPALRPRSSHPARRDGRSDPRSRRRPPRALPDWIGASAAARSCMSRSELCRCSTSRRVRGAARRARRRGRSTWSRPSAGSTSRPRSEAAGTVHVEQWLSLARCCPAATRCSATPAAARRSRRSPRAAAGARSRRRRPVRQRRLVRRASRARDARRGDALGAARAVRAVLRPTRERARRRGRGSRGDAAPRSRAISRRRRVGLAAPAQYGGSSAYQSPSTRKDAQNARFARSSSSARSMLGTCSSAICGVSGWISPTRGATRAGEREVEVVEREERVVAHRHDDLRARRSRSPRRPARGTPGRPARCRRPGTSRTACRRPRAGRSARRRSDFISALPERP